MKPANLTLFACVLTTFILGSIHAFSVFLVPFEKLLEASRSDISLIYSGALVCLTVAVLLGHKVYPLLSAPLLAAFACCTAAIGLLIAGNSSSFFAVAFGYAVIFGGANGIGYGFVLQLSAQAMPDRKGMAMGAVTACYALGAALSPVIFKFGLASSGISLAMNLASVVFILIGCVIYLLLRRSHAVFQGEAKADGSDKYPVMPQLLLWLAYGTGSAAGLMIIGHATGILRSVGGSIQQSVWAVMLIAIGNMLGGLIAGWLADRIKLKLILLILPLCSGILAALINANSQPQFVLLGLMIIGFCYGAIIAVYPIVVSTMFGQVASPRIYGRVFTAWGLAGLIAPWLAGYFYDQTGGYQLALVVAGAVSLVSVVAVLFIPSLDQGVSGK